MLKRKIYHYITAGILILAIGLILPGCNGSKAPSAGEKKVSDVKTQTPPVAAESIKGSTQLWAENCSRCHNLRSPTSYSQNEWQVAMHHMRVRGYLTGEEQRRILAYLQASN